MKKKRNKDRVWPHLLSSIVSEPLKSLAGQPLLVSIPSLINARPDFLTKVIRINLFFPDDIKGQWDLKSDAQ
jgi:hypothetical protein